MAKCLLRKNKAGVMIYYQPKQRTVYGGILQRPRLDLLLFQSPPKWVPFNDPCQKNDKHLISFEACSTVGSVEESKHLIESLGIGQGDSPKITIYLPS